MVALHFAKLQFTTTDIWLRGYVWIIMQVGLGAVVTWQMILWFPHFRKRRSPLQYTYPSMLLSCIAFTLNGIGNTKGGIIPIAYELGLGLIGTGLSFILFAWGMIVTKVLFATPSTERKILIAMVVGNASFYVLLIFISVLNNTLSIVPCLLFDLGLIGLYMGISYRLRKKMTKQQLALVNKITRMTDILCASGIISVIGLVLFQILIFVYPKHIIQTIFYFVSRVVLWYFVAFTIYHLQKFGKARLKRDAQRGPDSGTTASGTGTGSGKASGPHSHSLSSSDDADSASVTVSVVESDQITTPDLEGEKKEKDKDKEGKEERKEDEKIDVTISQSQELSVEIGMDDLGASTDIMMTSASTENLVRK